MLSPRLTNCPECANICTLINQIDCKVNEMSKALYNNTVYMLNNKIDNTAILDLLNYRRILTYKMFNPDYAIKYSVDSILGKVKRLTAGCVSKCNDCNTSNFVEPTTTTTTVPVTTTTTSSSEIIIPECSTFITSAATVSYYDFDTNSIINLFTEGLGGWNDIANTNNKLWISNLVGIKEYDITLNPWSVSFNRDILINAGPGLAALNNNFLIGSIGNKIILIDISGVTPTYIELVTLPSFGSIYGSSISGDIMLTSDNKLLCTVASYMDQEEPVYIHSRLLQYDFATMNLEIVVDLYPTILGPFGLTQKDGITYIFDSGDPYRLFSISNLYPYEIIEVDNLSAQVLGASVEKDCVTTSFVTTTTTTTIPPTTTTTTTIQVWLHYFSNNATDAISACSKFVTLYTFYSTDEILTTGSILYTDVNLTIPFIGNSQWYKKLFPEVDIVYQINNIGEVINTSSCV